MKISVVMQSYLGDYPGSRSRPEYKFTRAVHSFLSQLHGDKELVVVADGCEKTKLLYETLYRGDPRIKFAYLAPEARRMYDIKDGVKFYRGTPRRIGCSLATGDIITYMDSDDIMLPNRLSDLARDWFTKDESVKWGSNTLRFLSQEALKSPLFNEQKTPVTPANILNLRDIGYDVSDLFWLNVMVPDNMVSAATYSLSHRKDTKAVWRDVEVVHNQDGKIMSGVSEDHAFLRELMAHDRLGFRQESPAYVVCHYNGIWDV